jgi:O-succinylbenzoic acid--CoA ligase
MTDWLFEAARLFSSKDFILTGGKTYSFSEINDSAESLSSDLKKEYNLFPGDLIAIVSDNNLEFIILVFALWKTGAIPVPINTRLNETEKNNLLEFLNPKLIYDLSSPIPTLSSPRKQFVPTSRGKSHEYVSSQSRFDLADINTIALILFTSGSTGKPKAVQLSFLNLKKSFENSDTMLNQNSNDKWIASLPFFHIGGFSIIIRSLFSGTLLIIPKSLQTDDILQDIKKYKPTLVSLVSTQLRRLIDIGLKPDPSMKCLLLGGGYIDNSLVEESLAIGWPIAKVYGSTETSSLVSFLDCMNEKNKIPSTGKPLGNNMILIVDRNRNPLPYNSHGEIAIKSESCTSGYLDNPREKKRKFINGFYYTGDHGFLDKEGYLFVDARRSDLIISGGENINPLEIENALREFPGIAMVSVFGEDDREWGQIVSAAVKTKSGKNISKKNLKEFLSKKLSPYKIPKRFYFINEFPVSPLGKIQKAKLIEMIKK